MARLARRLRLVKRSPAPHVPLSPVQPRLFFFFFLFCFVLYEKAHGITGDQRPPAQRVRGHSTCRCSVLLRPLALVSAGSDVIELMFGARACDDKAVFSSRNSLERFWYCSIFCCYLIINF